MGLADKILVIVNQNSRIRNFDKKLLNTISREIVLRQSTSLDTFSQILQNHISDGIRNIVICGGDGSLHHLVNLLIKNHSNNIDEFKIALLPFGTGNDWVRNFSLKPFNHIINKISNNETRKIDIGKIEFANNDKRYFVNLCGVGFNTQVITNVDKFKKLGAISYYLALVYTLIGYKAEKIICEINNTIVDKNVFIASIGIGKFAGGNMKICPDAIIDDGFFDIKIIENTSKWNLIKNLLRLQKGTHLSYLKHLSFSSYKIEFTEPIDKIEADGELIEGKVSKIEIIPKAISFYV